jgi:hypothetical protein
MSGIPYMLRVRICKRIRSSGIDSDSLYSIYSLAGPVRQIGFLYRPARLGIESMGSVKGFQIRAQVIFVLYSLFLRRFGNFGGKVLTAVYRPSRARIFKRLWSPEIDSKASIPPAYVPRGPVR